MGSKVKSLDDYNWGGKHFIDYLEWNVFLYDFNTMKPKVYNIMDNSYMKSGLKDIYKNCKDSKEEFSTEVEKLIKWCFWGRCEYEFIISSWPPCDRDKQYKMDVYEQLMINFNRMIEYLWRK